MINIFVFIVVLILCVGLLLYTVSVDRKLFVVICCILGTIGVVCALIGHYGTLGFDIKRFVLFELPMYIFIVWAIMYGIVVPIKHIFQYKSKEKV